MSNIVILSDLHFGLRRNSKVFHEILTNALDWSFKHIKKNDTVVILGDIFDSRSAVDFKILNDAWNYFIKLSRCCKEVYILAGNHDEYYKETSRENTNCRFLEFEPGSDSKISPVKVITELSDIRLNNKRCLFIPWIDTMDRKDAAKKALGGEFDLIFGHFDLLGIYTKETALSDTLSFVPADFPDKAMILSGHYHKRIIKENVRYVGAFINSTFNDIDDSKGLHIISEDGTIEFKANGSPKFHHLTIDNPLEFINAFKASDLKVRQGIEKIVNGNFIKLILSEYRKENDEVFNIIKSMSPMDVSILFNQPSLINEEDMEDFGGFDNKTDIAVVLHQYIDSIKDKIPEEVTIESVKDLINRKSVEFKQSSLI